MTGDLHDRDLTDQAFYEWLLSDHPDAKAERDWRRAATYQAETTRAAQVRAWADKINASPDAPQTLRNLAASMGPLADQTLARAEASHAEPDDTYVTRLRAQHETYMQVSGPDGSWDYRYPAHLTGPGAAAYPPPPQPDAPEPEAGQMITAPDPEPADAELAAEAEADWAHEWDDADSAAYQARLEAGLEPEAQL